MDVGGMVRMDSGFCSGDDSIDGVRWLHVTSFAAQRNEKRMFPCQ